MKLEATENILGFFDEALLHTAGVDSVTSEVRQTASGLKVVTRATLRLEAQREFVLTKLAIEHAADPEAYVRAVAEGHYKPFGRRLEMAAIGAAAAWSAALDN